MSAKESLNFVHFFSLIIGDLVSQDCPVSKFFLNLQKLLDVCLQSNFREEDLELLHKLTSYHNKQYVKLFNEALKPKARLITHYVTIIRRLGLRIKVFMVYEIRI